MSRKSYQKVTLSVELTLLPGLKPKDAEAMLKSLLQIPDDEGAIYRAAQTIIKIIKRETIYVN